MNRRKFIKTTAMAGVFPLGLQSCGTQNTDSGQDSELSCFIFSDAHIGWKGKAQPTKEMQAKMIQVIKQNFPAFDLVFDTGDVHHADIYDEERRLAREFWLQQMAGQFYDSRFHYIPGNHELDRGRYDAEVTAGELGSFNFRPYYSFDYKGIHFVSLPQLLDTIYITKETLNWLQQDLILNADKTTLIFSHNSIQGTTFNNGETGYRETVNSKDVLDIIDSHDQVLGWFHGHNHQYEIVKKHNRLYVSNGRIGGFNPPKSWGPFGQGHLGGIYIKINHKGMVVSGFSATEGKFLDQLGWPNLSAELLAKTTFDPKGKFNYYFGHGRLVNGVKHQMHSHYLSEKKVEVIVSTTNNHSINENYQFSYPSKFFFAGKETNRIMGFSVVPRNTNYLVKDQGLEIELNEMVRINIPNWGLNRKNYMARSGYYRCAQGQKLKLSIECGNLNGSENIFYEYRLLNRAHDTLLKVDFLKIEMLDGKGEVQINIPENIDAELNHQKLYIVFTLKVLGFNKTFLIKSVELNQIESDGKESEKSEIILNGKKFEFDSIGHKRIDTSDLFKNGVADLVLTKSASNQAILMKITDVKWQVRNAIASFVDNKIVVHNSRSDFQKNQEIIFTPSTDIESYIAKTHNLYKFEINLSKSVLKIDVFNPLKSESMVMLKTKKSIVSIVGGKFLYSKDVGSHWIVLNKSQLIIELE